MEVTSKSDAFVLRQSLGNGERGETEFCVSLAVPPSAVIVEIEDRFFFVNIKDIVEEAFKRLAREKRGELSCDKCGGPMDKDVWIDSDGYADPVWTCMHCRHQVEREA